MTKVQWTSIILISLLLSDVSMAAKCFYVSSYHQGYEWSDDIEKGLKKRLNGKCEFKQFNMDTKRNKSEEFKKAAGLKAKRLILEWQPDIIIASDDNASKYVIKPFFKDHAIPVVFCGVNWNVDAYGYPYNNATGMVEIAPIAALLTKASDIRGILKTAYFLSVDVTSEVKNLKRYKQVVNKMGIDLQHALVTTMQEWIVAYKEAQKYDVIILGSHTGISDWDKQKIIKLILSSTRQLSVTTRDWMMDYTILGFTKIAEEQGDWAGQVALAILDGTKPSQIPVVSNRKWDIWLNEAILAKTNISIPKKLMVKANKVASQN